MIVITPDQLDIEPTHPVLSDAAVEALARLLVDAAMADGTPDPQT